MFSSIAGLFKVHLGAFEGGDAVEFDDSMRVLLTKFPAFFSTFWALLSSFWINWFNSTADRYKILLTIRTPL